MRRRELGIEGHGLAQRRDPGLEVAPLVVLLRQQDEGARVGGHGGRF